MKPDWPLISPDSPKVSDPAQLKGVIGTINQYFYQSRISLPRLVRQNQFFKCFYFPPDIILGLFRKSSPAIRVKYDEGYFVNDPNLKDVNKSKFGKSLNPMDYSFIRLKTRRLIKKLFAKNFTEVQGKDGLYVFNISQIPKLPQEIELVDRDIRECLNMVNKLKHSVFKVEETNSRVNWKHVQYLLDLEGYKFGDDLIEIIERSQKLRVDLQQQHRSQHNKSNKAKKQKKKNNDKKKN